jgi:hypothetical protein
MKDFIYVSVGFVCSLLATFIFHLFNLDSFLTGWFCCMVFFGTWDLMKYIFEE